MKQQYIASDSGQVVERTELHQGYEFAKGQFVVFSQDEVKAMNVEATNAIGIAEFVPLAEIERIYIDKVYYLGPDKGAGRSYHLLKEALATTQRAALASYAARGKCYLVLIRPMGEGLVMEQLKHKEELRSFDDVPLDYTDVPEAELDLAIKIIGQRVNEQFEPEKYEDQVRSRMREMIQQKIDGQEISMPTEQPYDDKIVDLMEALKASVEGKAHAKKSPKRKTAQRAARKASPSKAKSSLK